MKNGVIVHKVPVATSQDLIDNALFGLDGKGTHGICTKRVNDQIAFSIIVRSVRSPKIEITEGVGFDAGDLDKLIERLTKLREGM